MLAPQDPSAGRVRIAQQEWEVVAPGAPRCTCEGLFEPWQIVGAQRD